ncbi:MAG: aspartate/glutamate racemase family protein [Lachnospiraceae bacterium]|nr:aspartate/glutamate racemase family protein [Lachnospiraceae bacterium]
MSWQGRLESEEDLYRYHTTPSRYTAGFAIGIIAVELIYPKLPGNVANATTYPFPVLYQKVSFEIERLFEGDASIRDEIIAAARNLESEGVRAIVGACGYFAHFQQDVARAVNVPVFLSSLCQLPMIKTAVSDQKKIAILAASGDNIGEEVLQKVGTTMDRLVVENIGDLPEFHAIRYGETGFDNEKLKDALCLRVEKLVKAEPQIGAVLLECSDLPPYAKAIQQVSGLPVFDFNTMIDLVYHAVVQRTYYGYF